MDYLVCYDVPEDYPNLRNKIIKICKDYGLIRLQYSVFWGSLTQAQARDLSIRCADVSHQHPLDVRCIAVCADCFRRSFAVIKNVQVQTQDAEPLANNPLYNLITHTTVGWDPTDRRALRRQRPAVRTHTDQTIQDPPPTRPITVQADAAPPENPFNSTEPVSTKPISTEPISTKPISTIPISTEPISTEPNSTEPISTEPISIDQTNSALNPPSSEVSDPNQEIAQESLTKKMIHKKSAEKPSLRKGNVQYANEKESLHEDTGEEEDPNENTDLNRDEKLTKNTDENMALENQQLSFELPADLTQLSWDQVLELTGMKKAPLTEALPSELTSKEKPQSGNSTDPRNQNSIVEDINQENSSQGKVCQFENWEEMQTDAAIPSEPHEETPSLADEAFLTEGQNAQENNPPHDPATNGENAAPLSNHQETMQFRPKRGRGQGIQEIDIFFV